jgi:hypothetical protein
MADRIQMKGREKRQEGKKLFRQFKIELKPAPVGSSVHKKWGSRATNIGAAFQM